MSMLYHRENGHDLLVSDAGDGDVNIRVVRESHYDSFRNRVPKKEVVSFLLIPAHVLVLEKYLKRWLKKPLEKHGSVQHAEGSSVVSFCVLDGNICHVKIIYGIDKETVVLFRLAKSDCDMLANWLAGDRRGGVTVEQKLLLG